MKKFLSFLVMVLMFFAGMIIAAEQPKDSNISELTKKYSTAAIYTYKKDTLENRNIIASENHKCINKILSQLSSIHNFLAKNSISVKKSLSIYNELNSFRNQIESKMSLGMGDILIVDAIAATQHSIFFWLTNRNQKKAILSNIRLFEKFGERYSSEDFSINKVWPSLGQEFVQLKKSRPANMEQMAGLLLFDSQYNKIYSKKDLYSKYIHILGNLPKSGVRYEDRFIQSSGFLAFHSLLQTALFDAERKLAFKIFPALGGSLIASPQDAFLIFTEDMDPLAIMYITGGDENRANKLRNIMEEKKRIESLSGSYLQELLKYRQYAMSIDIGDDD